MKKNWEPFFEMLIKHEGGFTDDQRDSGNRKGDGHGNEGSTMLGVTSWNWAKYTGKPAPKEVMKKLTKDDVKPLYKQNYWNAVKADNLPSGLDVSCADLCVNAGPSRASKILQRVVGQKRDGKIGPMTLKAVQDKNPKDLLEKYYHGREAFYRSLGDYEIYGKGWSRRNKETLEKALELLDE
jgi:lysozyme family protein